MKIFLYFIGKPRDRNANAMAAEYIKRSTRYAQCEMREIPDPEKTTAKKLVDPFEKHPNATKILLDPQGKALDTPGFIQMVREQAEVAGRDLVFILGGSDGLPADWRPRADVLIQLTPLTLPHELARVMLAEQIYRALCALRGHPYPR